MASLSGSGGRLSDVLGRGSGRSFRSVMGGGSVAGADNSTLVQQAKATTIVAIDIGTYGSGFAYVTSYPGERARPRVCVHTDWPNKTTAAPAVGGAGGTATGPAAVDQYPKTRSALLLKGGKGVEFGWTAVRKYFELSGEERTDGRYFLVYGTAFKLGLQDPTRVPPNGLPEGISPHDAFSEFLRLLKVYILRHLQQQAAHGAGSTAAAAAAAASAAATARGMIRWCLTVPALWTDGCKAAVRRSALRAGLITQLDSEELTVVLEPEAAALQISVGADRSLLFPAALGSALAVGLKPSTTPAPDAASLKPGEVFMVVDAGGGTVDITIHGVEERGGTAVLSEAQAVPGLGEFWGATDVDTAFAEHFRSKVGEEVFDDWQAAHRGVWFRLLEEYWEPIKSCFDSASELPEVPAGPQVKAASESGGGGSDVAAADDDVGDADEDWAGGGGGGGGRRRTTWRVPIPPTLHFEMDPGVRAALLMEYGLDDSIVLDRCTMAGLFENSVRGIIDAASRQLQALAAAPCAPTTRCSKVMLAGGFGCSRYLQSQLAAALCGRLVVGGGVVVPEHPAAAVLQGATQYGLKPELIRARSSRLTYGVRTAVPYEDGMPARFWHPAECCYYSAAGFSPFVIRGQLVEAEEVVTHVFTPLSPDQQIASVELWATDKLDVRWINAEDLAGEEVAEGRPGAAGGGAGGANGSGMRRVGDVQVILLRDVPTPSTVPLFDGGRAPLARRGGSAGEGDEGEGDEDDERLIEVSLAFGRTEIRVTARDMMTGRRFTTRVKFAYSW